MEKDKEISIPKPGDLLLGVIDFFAILVPGVICAALIFKSTGRHLGQANNVQLIAVLTVGWVLGHVLHGLGSKLDTAVYDRLFKPSDLPEAVRHREASVAGGGGQNRLGADSLKAPGVTRERFHTNDRLYRLAVRLTDYPDKLSNPSAGIPGGMYQWARAWLNTHSPETTSILNRREADSKFFRSLTILSLIALLLLLCIALSPEKVGAAIPIADQCWLEARAQDRTFWEIITGASMAFSLWRYCDLRHKMIRDCYLSYVQLRFKSER